MYSYYMWYVLATTIFHKISIDFGRDIVKIITVLKITTQFQSLEARAKLATIANLVATIDFTKFVYNFF